MKRMMASDLLCKLYQNDKLIDDEVRCKEIQFNEDGPPYSGIIDGQGEIETSKPLKVTYLNFKNIGFELIFDFPIYRGLNKVPIFLTEVNWDERKKAKFEIGQINEE